MVGGGCMCEGVSASVCVCLLESVCGYTCMYV